jgi:hypothetical protein
MAQPIDPNYQKLRGEAFNWDAKAPDGALRGIIMETGYDRGIVTFAAMSDSSVSIYFSWGGGMIGAGSHDRPAAAARNLAIGVARSMELFKKTSDTTPPRLGETKFFVLVDRDILGAGAKEQELQSGNNKLAPIYQAAHAVMNEVRKLYDQIPPDQRPKG